MEIKKKARILSIDGGGIRGVIPAIIMQYVEEELIKRTGNPDARIADYFDMIVGTSTGAILGCFYLVPNESGKPTSKFTAKQALELYSEKGSNIFNDAKKFEWLGIRQLFNSTRYSPKNIEQIFQETVGDLLFDELLKPCIVTSYNMQKGEAVFFNSRECEQQKSKRKFYTRDVLRSTSAAPTYFPPAAIKNLATGETMVNLDGGVFANNPAMCAYAESRTTHFEEVDIQDPSATDLLILSIGTGSTSFHAKKGATSAKNWGVISWAKSVPDIMMDGGLDTVNYQINKIFNSQKDSNDRKNFKRVNVPDDFIKAGNEAKKTPYNSDMSDASKENIEKLKIAGQEALKDANLQKKDECTLDEFIDQLIAIDKLIHTK